LVYKKFIHNLKSKNMEKNKLLTTLAIVFIASAALFTGCNKEGFNKHNGLGPDNYNFNANQIHGGGITTSPVNLGTAVTFAVLGGTTVTNAGPSVITGDLGVSSGTTSSGFAITGFLATNRIVLGPLGTVTSDEPGVVTGTIYAGDAVAAQAHADAQIAYDYLVAQVPTTFFGEVQQLNGLTLTPGIYKFPTSADLAAEGILYLDFGGDPNALFIFQIGTTLVTKLNSQIIATNNGGATTCLGSNVFWAVGSSATIDGSSFIGTVIAYTSISMTSAANTIKITNVAGRMLALGGAVTMSTDNISTCGTSVGSTKPPKPCRDFVTGGGWINHKATFGVSGGIKNGKYWGQLSFNDHNGTSVKSTSVTAYTYINATTRRIDGLAKVNGHGSYAYSVVVTDNGEPGRDDHFILNVNIDGVRYHAEGDLIGGNIQLHMACGDSNDNHDKGDKKDQFKKDQKDDHNNGDKEEYSDKDENDGNSNCENHE
jgi:Ice-binding-like